MCHSLQDHAGSYGIDPHGPVPTGGENDTDVPVVIPETVCPLSAEQMVYFNEQVTFNPQDENTCDIFDENAYLRAVDIVQGFTQP